MNKFTKATSLISEHYKGGIKINLSPACGYRSRCEFGYRNSFYTMYDRSGNIQYLEVFNIARPAIQDLMPKLRKMTISPRKSSRKIVVSPRKVITKNSGFPAKSHHEKQ